MQNSFRNAQMLGGNPLLASIRKACIKAQSLKHAHGGFVPKPRSDSLRGQGEVCPAPASACFCLCRQFCTPLPYASVYQRKIFLRPARLFQNCRLIQRRNAIGAVLFGVAERGIGFCQELRGAFHLRGVFGKAYAD